MSQEYQGTESLTLENQIHLWEIASLDIQEKKRLSDVLLSAKNENEDASKPDFMGILGHYGVFAGDELAVNRRKLGKPYIQGGPEFSLSHTAGRAFLAVSERELGVDVESLSRNVHAEEIAGRYFFPEELEYVNRAASAEKNQLFLRLWVCKEAMVKLTGDGLAHGLQKARVILGTESPEGQYGGQKVWLQLFYPAGNLIGAVATWEKMCLNSFLPTAEIC